MVIRNMGHRLDRTNPEREMKREYAVVVVDYFMKWAERKALAVITE